MRKITSAIVSFLIFLTLVVSPTFAQDNHTAREEAEGKVIWEKLQAKQLECKNLTDNNFESLGEYFMGKMTGGSHEAMNTMMEQMMGKAGEEQMHVVMGKRLSDCVLSTKGGAYTMMGYGWNNMMGGWGGFGLVVTLFWILIFINLILLAVFLWKKIADIKKQN